MRRPARSRALRPWYRNGTLVAGIVIVGLLVLVAVLAPLLTPYDPITQDLEHALQQPSAQHWLGTDKYGRAVLIPFVVGSVLGALAGYFGGWFDAIVMRVVDVFFAFPFYVLVIVLVFVLGAGESSIYLAIATVSWVSYAKIMRGELLVAKQQDYVMAARLGGFSHLKVLARHIGPNVLSQAIIYAMSDIVQD